MGFFGKTYPKVSSLFEYPREILLFLNFLFTISNGKRVKKQKNFQKTYPKLSSLSEFEDVYTENKIKLFSPDFDKKYISPNV